MIAEVFFTISKYCAFFYEIFEQAANCIITFLKNFKMYFFYMQESRRILTNTNFSFVFSSNAMLFIILHVVLRKGEILLLFLS